MSKWKQKYAILAVLTPVIVLVDQLTKLEILRHFRLGETLPVITGVFDLTYVRNTGAAFGLLAHADPQWRIPFFIVVPLAALGAIAWVFRKIEPFDVKMSAALSLVIGGAIGNLIDRARLNFVIDFLLFHWRYEWQFPAFNVADSAICIGVGILMLDLLLEGDKGKSHAPRLV